MATYLKIKRNTEWDEWIVAWIEDGKRNEDKTYHSDDLEDACLTAVHMAKAHGISEIRTASKKASDMISSLPV